METLEQAVVEVIKKSTSGVEKSIEFFSKELPEIAQQLLYWNFIEKFTYFIISILILTTTIILFIKITDKVINYIYEDEEVPMDDRVFIYLLGVALSTPTMTISVILFNIEWIKILVAPKVWLIEYASTLVK